MPRQSHTTKSRRASVPAQTQGFDWLLLLPVLFLLAVGLLMVASASMVVSDHFFHNPFHFLIRHSIYIALGLAVMYVLTRVPAAFWQKHCFFLLFASVFLLILVLIPGIGREVNGARRWIALPFTTFQVAELTKWVSILFVANYISRYNKTIQTDMMTFIRPLILLLAQVVLLLLEPDFGSVAVVMLTTLCLLFLAKAPLRPFVMIALLVALGMGLLVWAAPYRFERLISFLDPWARQFGSGYQLTQSLIAFGRGGVMGVGLGNGMQKLFYLPEAHTDFLFAVLGEEWGLIGCVLTLLLYALLFARLLFWGNQLLKDGRQFASYYCYGVAIWLGLQTLINMGVTVGLLPTKGLTLPFISYGGTSLVVSCAAIGLALRLIYERGSNDREGEKKWQKKQHKQRF